MAVIGGGIAGATTVISLAKAGVNLVWLRPAWQATAYKVGESLAPAANPILSSLGLLHLLEGSSHRRANVTFSAWGQNALSERNSVVHLEGAGSIIDRMKFEQDLFLLANDVSTLVIEDTLQTLSEDEGHWEIKGHSGTQAKSRFVIDATGRSQVLGKRLANSGHIQSKTSDHLVSVYSFLNQKNTSNVTPTPATLIESVADGWWYASLLPSQQLALNYYSDPDIMPKGLTTDLNIWLDLIQQTTHIAHWIEDAEFELDSPPQLTSASTRWLTPAADVHNGAGWAAIGDAAVAFDPLSAHGMTTALWAAARMPEVVQTYLVGNLHVLNQYAGAVEEGRKEYEQQRNAIYLQEKRFQQNVFWQRRNIQK